MTSRDHPECKSIRLPHYDYSATGGYFVTINAYHRELLFGKVVGSVMRLNELGEIVRAVWEAIPEHFKDVAIDEFVVMPNHFHGIVFIYDQDPVVRATHASPLPKAIFGLNCKFIQIYRQQTHQPIRNLPGHPVWQRSYYDSCQSFASP